MINKVIKKNKVKKKYCSKLKCTLVKCLEYIFEKIEHYLEDENLFNNMTNLIVIFAGDGARHQVIEEGDMNVISFNLLIINKELHDPNITITQINSYR